MTNTNTNTNTKFGASVVSYEDFSEIYDPSKNKSVKFITDYEICAVIGTRRQQLENGAPTVLSDTDIAKYGPFNNVWEMADIEYKLNVIPFIIVRTFPNRRKEYWRIEDLIKRE